MQTEFVSPLSQKYEMESVVSKYTSIPSTSHQSCGNRGPKWAPRRHKPNRLDQSRLYLDDLVPAGEPFDSPGLTHPVMVGLDPVLGLDPGIPSGTNPRNRAVCDPRIKSEEDDRGRGRVSMVSAVGIKRRSRAWPRGSAATCLPPSGACGDTPASRRKGVCAQNSDFARAPISRTIASSSRSCGTDRRFSQKLCETSLSSSNDEPAAASVR